MGAALEMLQEVHLDGIERRVTDPTMLKMLRVYGRASDAGVPPLAKFSPEVWPECAAHLAVVHRLPDGDYIYDYYGRAIATSSGIEMQGSRVSQWPSQIGRFFCAAYDRALAEWAPVYTLHRAHHAVRVHLWERLILPVAREDGETALVVFNRPREYVDELLRTLLEACPDAIIGLRARRDETGAVADAAVLTANASAESLFDRALQDVLNKPVSGTFPRLAATRLWKRCLTAIDRRCALRRDVVVGQGGLSRTLSLRAIPLADGLVLSIADVTHHKTTIRQLATRNAELDRVNQLLATQTALLELEVRRRDVLEAELRRRAEIDEITDVATRRAFMEAMINAIASHRPETPLALIAIDIDHFKRINDSHGHLVGDRVLNCVGREIRGECRTGDVVGRLGGEEFAILMVGSSVEFACRVAERLRQRFMMSNLTDERGAPFALTASFGVAAYRSDDSLQSWLARADEQLYRAKHAGRNCVRSAQSHGIVAA